MEVINPRSALLSNYEVLQLLRELESDHIARSKTLVRIKKEEELSGGVVRHDAVVADISENLRTIEMEAIQYLTADYQPTHLQTPAGIRKLVKDLAPFELTKSEKLQVVNLAPTEAVELYVIVEELEDRLGDRMEDILSVVRSSLSADPSVLPSVDELPTPELQYPGTALHDPSQWGEADAEGFYDESAEIFDDLGQGKGVEGDLDMEDEED